MELSKFLKQDIIDFLERKSSEQREKLGKLRGEEFTLFDVDRDYAKETAEALEQNDQSKAKKLFDELREAYNSLGENEVDEREKIYAILEEVYAEIKKSIEHGMSLEDDLKDFEKHGLKGVAPPPSKGGATLPGKEETEAFERAALQAQQQREKAEKAMKFAEHAVHRAVEEGDVQGAAKAYNDFKHEFSVYPSDDKFRKVEWYNHLLASYEQVRRLQAKQREEAEKRRAQADDERRKDAETKEKEERRKQSINRQLHQTKDKMKDLIHALDGEDLHAADSLLIDARHLVAKLGKEVEKEKRGLESILSTITNRIQFLKQERAKRDAEEQRRWEEEERRREAATEEEERRRREAAERRRQEEEKRRIDAITRARGGVESLYQEGLRYQHAGEPRKAEACFREILRISPHHLPALIRLEQLQQGENREEAEAP